MTYPNRPEISEEHLREALRSAEPFRPAYGDPKVMWQDGRRLRRRKTLQVAAAGIFGVIALGGTAMFVPSWLESRAPEVTPAGDTDDSLSPQGCPPITPPRLLDGTMPGQPGVDDSENYTDYRWASDDGSLIIQRVGVGLPDFSLAEISSDKQYLVMPVGDWGVSEVQVRFEKGDCQYITWLPPGTTENDARDFAKDLAGTSS